ncbi:MAG: glycosyltransferase [Sneathiellaceae bacterium]
MPAAGHLLILEPKSAGHVREWIGHILAACDLPGPPRRLTFAIGEDLASEFGGPLPDGVDLVALDPALRRRCMDRRPPVSAFARWQAMRRLLAHTGAGHGLFLECDHVALPLALGLRIGRARLSGILFRPSAHYRAIDGSPSSRRERLRDLVKDLTMRLALRNPALDTVFSLDPYFPAFARNRYGGGRKVRALGDPAAPRHRHTADAPVPGAADGRRVFLLFGEITHRKGAAQLLRALARLRPEVAATVAVVLAGRIDPAIAPELDALQADIRERRSGLALQVIDRWLSEQELDSLVDRCDVVLAPYQRFVGSSGVLIRAAAAGKPVICQRYGLLGRLVAGYRLGLAVDSSDPDALAAAVTAFARDAGPDRSDGALRAAFLRERRPALFAWRILELAAPGRPSRRDGPVARCHSAATDGHTG